MKTFLQNGNLPTGWRISRVGSVGKIVTGSTPSRRLDRSLFLGDIPWVKTGDLTNGQIWQTEEMLSEAGLSLSQCQMLPEHKTVLVAMYGGYNQIGRTGLLMVPAATNQAISAVVCDEKEVVASYLLYWLNGFRFLWKDFAGSSRKDPNITRADVVSFPLVKPPLSEQRKIADVLTTWDEALEKLDALIEAKQRRKKALMQQLLSGKRRQPKAEKWKMMRLGDLAENVSDLNNGRMDTSRLYAVTKAEGMVPMREHVKGASFDRCKRVETDWFAYNPMRINIGSIARWKGKQPVMVSADYVVFRCIPNRLSPAFLDQVRRSKVWESFVTRGGNGSVRIRIYFSDLAEFTFKCPPLEEQMRIAEILEAADEEIKLLRAQRAAIDQQKRGLMQRLLTGKLRVKV